MDLRTDVVLCTIQLMEARWLWEELFWKFKIQITNFELIAYFPPNKLHFRWGLCQFSLMYFIRCRTRMTSTSAVFLGWLCSISFSIFMYLIVYLHLYTCYNRFFFLIFIFFLVLSCNWLISIH